MLFKEAREIGIKNLEAFNMALLGKLRSKMLKEKDNLWCRVLKEKKWGDNWKDGKKVKIWENKWVGGESLSTKYNIGWGYLGMKIKVEKRM
ncbi:hypothetical protein CR513_04887, partial [Mucuna pruriens]